MPIINGSIQIAYDTLANWTAWNGILLAGQTSIVSNAASDSVRIKIGDGVTTWNSLAFYSPSSGGGETLAQTLALGYNTGGNPIRANDGDPIYIGTDETRYIYYNSISPTPGLFLVNNNSGEYINLRDAGGLDVNGTVVTMAELGRLSGVTSSIQTQLNAKQATLVSATNIKTVGGVSLLGAGDLGSISTTYTDAKIKGSVGATSGLIPYGNGTADTVTSVSTFKYDANGNLLVGISTATSTNNILELQRSVASTLSSTLRNTSASAGAYTQYTASNNSTVVNLGLVGTGTATSGVYFQGQAYNITNSAGYSMGTLNASGNVRVYYGNGVLGINLASTGVITYGTSAASSQHIFQVGSSANQIILREKIGNTTQAAFYIGVASGSESSTNYTINYNGNLQINTQTTTSAMSLKVGDASAFTITPANTGSTAYFLFTPRARTTLATTANVSVFEVTGNTQTWAAGTVPLQYFTHFESNTMGFASGSTATFVASMAVDMPTRGTNATFTTAVGIHVPTLAYTSTTNAYAAYFDAPSGATNNYGLGVNGVSNFLGNVRLTQTVTTEAVTSDTTVTIVINGTTYKLLAKA